MSQEGETEGGTGQVAGNPLSVLMPTPNYEYLRVSLDKNLWIGPTAGTGAVTRISRRLPPLGFNDVHVKVKYCSLTMFTPEHNSRLDQIESSKVPMLCGLEAIGTIEATGRDVRNFPLHSAVFVFASKQRGHTTDVVISANNVFAIPSLDTRYLAVGWPMISARLIFEHYLRNSPANSEVLINDASTGTGLALCKEGHRLGFIMDSIAYNMESEHLLQPFTRARAIFASGLHCRRTEIRTMCQLGYDCIVTAAILHKDDWQIYKLFGENLKRNTSTLVLLCPEELVAVAAKFVPFNLLAKFGISLRWAVIDNEFDYAPLIRQNVTISSQATEAPNAYDSEVFEGLSATLMQRALANVLWGRTYGPLYMKM